MLTPKEIEAQLQDRVVNVVASECGLHPNAVRKIRDGRSKSPSYDLIKKLSDYLEPTEASGE
jgi:hypothetical protein